MVSSAAETDDPWTVAEDGFSAVSAVRRVCAQPAIWAESALVHGHYDRKLSALCKDSVMSDSEPLLFVKLFMFFLYHAMSLA